jgi:hypothetical protein
MGHREVRPVPLDWQHPVRGEPYRGGRPRYVPLHSRDDLRADLEDYAQNPEGGMPPDPADYMPEIPEGATVGVQLYETTSEGTPASPVFPTLVELAAWCETGADVVAGQRWTREQWLASFRAGTLQTDSLLRG